MALQNSGQISINDIRIELGIPNQSPFNLRDAVLGVYVAINQNSINKPQTATPNKLSDWYGYDHNAVQYFQSNVTFDTIESAACTFSPNTNVWHTSSNFNTATTLYSNSTGTSTVGAGFYAKDGIVLETNSNGLVINQNICSSGGGGGLS